MKTFLCENVHKSYKNNHVLKGVNLEIEAGKIYGLIGRSGVGKTTLLGVMSAQLTKDEGNITYGGRQVWENPSVLSELCFSRELNPQDVTGQIVLKVREYLKIASFYYPYWDADYADRLLNEFQLNREKRINELSRGMMSMVTIIVALASKAPITFLDEPVAGFDVHMRDTFYRFLLDDYASTNRTFILSTHIIEEAANLLEEVIILNDGIIAVKQQTQDLLDTFCYVTGPASEISQAVYGKKLLYRESVGGMETVCVERDIAKAMVEQNEKGYFNVTAVPLQKLFLYLTYRQ